MHYKDKTDLIYKVNEEPRLQSNAQVGQQLDEGKLSSSATLQTICSQDHSAVIMVLHYPSTLNCCSYMPGLLPGYTPNSDVAVTLATAA